MGFLAYRAAGTLTRASAWVGTNKPANNTYFGRTDEGVAGGITTGVQALHLHESTEEQRLS